MKKTSGVPAGQKLLKLIAGCAQDKKADKIVTLDLRGKNGPADWFFICEGENEVHTRAIFNNILFELKAKGIAAWHTEGETEGRWLVIDYSDVMVHVMTLAMRELYDLENLWINERREAA